MMYKHNHIIVVYAKAKKTRDYLFSKTLYMLLLSVEKWHIMLTHRIQMDEMARIIAV